MTATSKEIVTAAREIDYEDAAMLYYVCTLTRS